MEFFKFVPLLTHNTFFSLLSFLIYRTVNRREDFETLRDFNDYLEMVR